MTSAPETLKAQLLKLIELTDKATPGPWKAGAPQWSRAAAAAARRPYQRILRRNEVNSLVDFAEFPKIARYSRPIIITEKLDGTNAQVCISDDGLEIRAGSRSRWITPENDNFGFARWVEQNKEELLKLGPGRHFGEWWGLGIQRGYDLSERRFSLFNVGRWNKDNVPKCCHVVPIIHAGENVTLLIEDALTSLEKLGSFAAPGYRKPEGICIYHTAANVYFKKTLENDESPKTKVSTQDKLDNLLADRGC